MILARLVLLAALASSATTACPFAADGNAGTTAAVGFSGAFRAGLARAVHPHHPPMSMLTPAGESNRDDDRERRRRRLDALPPLDPATGPDYGGSSEGILYNNTFLNGAGLSRTAWRDPATGESFTIPEIIAMYQKGLIDPKGPGVGKDLCYWSFQSLPPPSQLDPSVPVVARNSSTNPNEPLTTYLYPKSDLPRYQELIEMAMDRLTNMIENDNPYLLFAAGATGWTSARALCEVGIDGIEGSYCDEPRSNSPIAWPHAIAIFRIDPDDTDAFHEYITNEWRDSPEGHLPNIFWTFAGGTGQTAPGNEEHGGITASVEAGWGSNGGLRAKIVQCDKIDQKFIRPMHGDAHVMGTNAIEEETGRTWGELAYKEWDRLRGIPLGEATSDCLIDADPSGDDSDDANEEDKPYAMLRTDETCMYESKYIADSASCGSKLDEAWGDETTYKMLNDKYNAMIESCGADFCASLEYTPSDGPFSLSDYGFPYCPTEGYRSPTQCDEGIEYMDSLAQYVNCTVHAGVAVSLLKKEASENAASVANKGASLQSCQDMIKCEEDVLDSITDDWSSRFCKNFFEVLLDPTVHPDDEFAWVRGCPIGAICSELFTGVAKDVDPDSAPGTVTESESGSGARNLRLGGIIATLLASIFLV